MARLALALERLGARPGDRVALLSENSPEWAIADFACICRGTISVPIYPTLLPAHCEYILKDSGACAIFVSTPEQLSKIESIRSAVPDLKTVILFRGQPPEGVLALADLMGTEPLAQEEDRRLEEMARAIGPEDLFSILYTSGTTGIPKGVMLTHHNICSNVQSAPATVGPEDLALSFLPLSHVYERMVDYAYLYRGAGIAYVERIDEVPRALLEVRPTLMAAVPRFFEKLYSRIMEGVRAAPPARQKLFWWAVGVGKRALPYRLGRRRMPPWLALEHAVAERLVFRRLRERVGGRLRVVTSGSAPLAPELAEFFLACGLTVCEGYGLTETSPVLTANLPESIKIGTVGRPIPGVEVKIAEDGEILVRGPNIMKGYYNLPEETSRALEGGWLHTGDIGRLDEDGYLIITDRKKDLQKTAGGKFVAPQPIENKLRTNPYILNAVVLADRRKFVSAIVVGNLEKLAEVAREQGLAFSSPAELARNPKILEFMEKQVEETTAGLAPYERVKKILLLEKDFSIEDGLLTPTMKVRRSKIEEQFRERIDALYG